jgi:transcriptional regulator with XRE-family HTH domain
LPPPVLLSVVVNDKDGRGAEVYRLIGESIARRRGQLRISQASLAQAVRLTRTSISNIEQGRQRMLIHTLIEIATALKVEPAELLPSTKEAAPMNISRNVSASERAIVEAILRE